LRIEFVTTFPNCSESGNNLGTQQQSYLSGGNTGNPFNQGSTSGSQVKDTSNIKGKIGTLEEMIKSLAEELNYHKKEVQVLRSEKETLESVLSLKTQEVRKALTNENFKVEEEMKRHYAFQKAENSRIQQQVTALRGEKTALDMQLLEMERRMAELEVQVGHEDH
jgi:chromosome segregation ATPase